MVVTREMIDDSGLAVEIGKKAVENSQKAWSSENINTGPEIVEV
jgi:S-methylmethionine-dependent homocysteine/selenocysteine methylase